MNLRQLSEMVNALRVLGYSEDTKIFMSWSEDDISQIAPVRQVTRCADDGIDNPPFVILSSSVESYPNCEAYNRDYDADPNMKFPKDFPGPDGE